MITIFISNFSREMNMLKILNTLLMTSLVCAAITWPRMAIAAEDYRPLDGQYRIWGKTLVDPPAGEPKDTHLYLYLKGGAAKELFESMHVGTKRDECRNDGSLTKIIGNTQCTSSSNGKVFECWLGLDIKNQRMALGVVC